MDSGHKLLFRKLFIALFPAPFAHRNTLCTDSKFKSCGTRKKIEGKKKWTESEKKARKQLSLCSISGLFISPDYYGSWAVRQQGNR